MHENDLWGDAKEKLCADKLKIFEYLKANIRAAIANIQPRTLEKLYENDLTPLDYFLWGDTKEELYVDKLETFEYLKANIHAGIANIQPCTLEKVHENWSDRIRCYDIRTYE